MAKIDWQKMYIKGRVKDINVSWTDEEMKIIVDSKFSAKTIKDLRNGIKPSVDSSIEVNNEYTQVVTTETITDIDNLAKNAPEEYTEAEEITIEELRERYEEKFDKQVPNNKKNNAEWIVSKLVD